MLALTGCDQIGTLTEKNNAGDQGAMALLQSGSPKICVAGEVRETLRELILPKLGSLNGYELPVEDKRAAINSIKVSFDNARLDSFDAGVSKASCQASASIEAAGDETGAAEEIEFVVSPSAEDDNGFVVSAGISTLRTAARSAITGILDQQLVQRAADAERSRELEEKVALARVVSSRWLVGRWIPSGAEAGACIDGPYDEYRGGGEFVGYESTGRWSLSSLDLNVRGQEHDETFSVDTKITAASRDGFTETAPDGQNYDRRRCSRSELRPTPVSIPAEVTQDDAV